jgi:hypothetical protein
MAEFFASGERPDPVDDGLALHAAASRARLAMVTAAAAVRTAVGHARRGPPMTRVLWFRFIMARR